MVDGLCDMPLMDVLNLAEDLGWREPKIDEWDASACDEIQGAATDFILEKLIEDAEKLAAGESALPHFFARYNLGIDFILEEIKDLTQTK